MVLFPTQLPEAFMISRECLMMNGSVFPFRYLSQRRSPQQATEPSKRKIKSRHARAKHAAAAAAAAKCSSRTSQREPPETLARFKIRARPKIRTEGKKRRRAAGNAALPAGGADGSGGSWNGVREREREREESE